MEAAGPGLADRVTDAVGRYGDSVKQSRTLRDLTALLGRLDAGAPLADRIEQLEELGAWLRKTGGVPFLAGLEVGPDTPGRTARLRLLLRVCKDSPETRAALAGVLVSVLDQVDGLELFAEAGLPNDRGLLDETTDRLSRRFLPRPPDDTSLGELVSRLFPFVEDGLWLAHLDADTVGEVVALFGHQPLQRERAALCDALSLLSMRCAALGLSEEIRARSPAAGPRESPFFWLPRVTDAVLIAASSTVPTAAHDLGVAAAQLRERIAQCRHVAAHVTTELERLGVSVDVVYRLDVIAKCMSRMELLLPMLLQDNTTDRRRAGTFLLAAMVQARLGDRSVRQLVGDNMRLLARKVIERVGHTGEHYITDSRDEYRRHVRAAMGGGVIVALSVLLKFTISGWGLAPLPGGFMASMNYAIGFVIIQLLGFSLATKQSSTTAATIAGAIHRAKNGEVDIDSLVELCARTTRSVAGAAFGNISAVVPTMLFLGYMWKRAYGPFLDAHGAEHVLHSLNPIHSWVILHGAIAGVLLWTSSVFAGWLENWAAYRRLPEAIARHRWGKRVGRDRMERVSAWFQRHIAGFGGNISLGFLLGMAAPIGAFTGLPIAVAHVTLASGTLALAAVTMGKGVLSMGFLWAMVGILCALTMNFMVSFWLAISVALRARGVTRQDRVKLWGTVIREFLRKPGRFFFGPKDTGLPSLRTTSSHGRAPTAGDGHGAAAPVPVPVATTDASAPAPARASSQADPPWTQGQ